jgi:hypothetical protein
MTGANGGRQSLPYAVGVLKGSVGRAVPAIKRSYSLPPLPILSNPAEPA